jgi:hypothetical protein
VSPSLFVRAEGNRSPCQLVSCISRHGACGNHGADCPHFLAGGSLTVSFCSRFTSRSKGSPSRLQHCVQLHIRIHVHIHLLVRVTFRKMVQVGDFLTDISVSPTFRDSFAHCSLSEIVLSGAFLLFSENVGQTAEWAATSQSDFRAEKNHSDTNNSRSLFVIIQD